MPNKWSEEELTAAVNAYREMQRKESEGEPYNKSKVYEGLGAAYGRTAKAFEFRMQNISSVLNVLGRPWIKGLPPAKNVGAGVTKRLEAILGGNASRRGGTHKNPPYLQKLPAMRGWLIGVARDRSVVRYGELMSEFEIDRFSLRHALSRLGHNSRDGGEPVLTALVVSKATGHCSSGIEAEFQIVDDTLERARLYSFWAKNGQQSNTPELFGDGLAARAARFASVAIRPDQAAFRRAVFAAFTGRCCISGCDVEAALDAAHRTGRDWRLGHNGAGDGYLLRKDLHALYDSGLLTIGHDGKLKFLGGAHVHYHAFDGATINLHG